MGEQLYGVAIVAFFVGHEGLSFDHGQVTRPPWRPGEREEAFIGTGGRAEEFQETLGYPIGGIHGEDLVAQPLRGTSAVPE